MEYGVWSRYGEWRGMEYGVCCMELSRGASDAEDQYVCVKAQRQRTRKPSGSTFLVRPSRNDRQQTTDWPSQLSRPEGCEPERQADEQEAQDARKISKASRWKMSSSTRSESLSKGSRSNTRLPCDLGGANYYIIGTKRVSLRVKSSSSDSYAVDLANELTFKEG